MNAFKDQRNNYTVVNTIELPAINKIVEISTHKVHSGAFVCTVRGFSLDGNFKVWTYGKDYSKNLRQDKFRGTANAVEAFHEVCIEKAGGKVAILMEVEKWYSVEREAQPLMTPKG